MPHTKNKSDNDTSTARSAKAQKADEVQQAGSAKAGAGHMEVPEGGKAEAPIHSKGKPMQATSRAENEGTTTEGTSSATAGKAEKEAALVRSVLAAPKPGLVYTATRKHAEATAAALRAEGVRAAAYHAGLAGDERDEVQRTFLTGDTGAGDTGAGDTEVVAATVAFGMGIDKQNVRFVFHLDVPGSLDAYYQEVGRAGRDSKPAQARLFYRPEDGKLQRFFAGSGGVPGEQLEKVARRVAGAKGPLTPGYRTRWGSPTRNC